MGKLERKEKQQRRARQQISTPIGPYWGAGALTKVEPQSLAAKEAQIKFRLGFSLAVRV